MNQDFLGATILTAQGVPTADVRCLYHDFGEGTECKDPRKVIVRASCVAADPAVWVGFFTDDAPAAFVGADVPADSYLATGVHGPITHELDMDLEMPEGQGGRYFVFMRKDGLAIVDLVAVAIEIQRANTRGCEVATLTEGTPIA
jgi:hypothetical protein